MKELTWDPWIDQAVFDSAQKAEHWTTQWEREEKGYTFRVIPLQLNPTGWVR